MEPILFFQHRFSELPGLQHANVVEYLLAKQGGNFVIEVSRSGGAAQTVCWTLQDITREYGEALLRFLYENAVPLENALGVLEDCAARA